MPAFPTESLTVAQLIDRFRGDAYLAHQWVTGAATDVVTTADGLQYPTLAKLIADSQVQFSNAGGSFTAGTAAPQTGLGSIDPTVIPSNTDGDQLWQTPTITPVQAGSRFLVEFSAQIDIDPPTGAEPPYSADSVTVALFMDTTLIGIVTEYFTGPKAPRTISVRAMVPAVSDRTPFEITCRIGSISSGKWYVGCLSSMDPQAPETSPHSDSVWSVKELVPSA
jgi:hypothetical protein